MAVAECGPVRAGIHRFITAGGTNPWHNPWPSNLEAARHCLPYTEMCESSKATLFWGGASSFNSAGSIVQSMPSQENALGSTGL